MPNSPARSTLEVGSVIADTYTLEQLIGRGGMGAVFLASHVRLPGKQVAIKVLHASATDAESIARFRHEAEIASRLNHPNIVQVHDYNTLPDGTPYLVLEYLIGETLAARLARGPIALEHALSIMREVGSALAAAHRNGVIHRDLKPQNIFLVRTEIDGRTVEVAKVLDFGISKMRSSQTVKTQEAALLGTPQYMSPEQAIGQHTKVDERTDVFALGSILYEMLAGHPAFSGGSIPEVVFKVVYEQPLPIADEAPTLPRAVTSAIETGDVEDGGRSVRDGRWVRRGADRRAARAAGRGERAARGGRWPDERGRQGEPRARRRWKSAPKQARGCRSTSRSARDAGRGRAGRAGAGPSRRRCAGARSRDAAALPAVCGTERTLAGVGGATMAAIGRESIRAARTIASTTEPPSRAVGGRPHPARRSPLPIIVGLGAPRSPPPACGGSLADAARTAACARGGKLAAGADRLRAHRDRGGASRMRRRRSHCRYRSTRRRLPRRCPVAAAVPARGGHRDATPSPRGRSRRPAADDADDPNAIAAEEALSVRPSGQSTSRTRASNDAHPVAVVARARHPRRRRGRRARRATWMRSEDVAGGPETAYQRARSARRRARGSSPRAGRAASRSRTDASGVRSRWSQGRAATRRAPSGAIEKAAVDRGHRDPAGAARSSARCGRRAHGSPPCATTSPSATIRLVPEWKYIEAMPAPCATTTTVPARKQSRTRTTVPRLIATTFAPSRSPRSSPRCCAR